MDLRCLPMLAAMQVLVQANKGDIHPFLHKGPPQKRQGRAQGSPTRPDRFIMALVFSNEQKHL